MHDYAGRRYIKRHGGIIDGEARLYIAVPAIIILAVCLLIFGFALEGRWHYMVLATLAAVQTFAALILTTSFNAYLLDCYPEACGDVGALLTLDRNWAGGVATLCQMPWVYKDGLTKTLGVQAAVTFCSVFPILLLIWRGKAIRQRQGRVTSI